MVIYNSFQFLAGAYADWLNFHQEHLQYVIPLMAAGVINERLVGSASQALRDLTLECPGTISPFALPILDACQKALIQFSNCDIAIKERLITIIARVLSVGVSYDVIIDHLNRTLTPIIGNINSIKEVVIAQNNISKELRVELVKQLRLLACLARSLHSNLSTNTRSNDSTQGAVSRRKNWEQPLLMVLRPLLSILDGVVDLLSHLPEVVEVLSKLLKNSISTLQYDIQPLLPDLLSIIPRIYQNSLSPAVLDFVKQLLILFGGVNSVHMQQMKAVTEGILSYTYDKVKGDLWSHTDVLQCIISFSHSICKKVLHLLNPETIHSIFILAIEVLKLPEEGTIKASASFLIFLLNLGREDKHSVFKGMIHQNIEYLVRTLVTCICSAPRHGLSHISELLLLICRFYGGIDLMNVFKKMEDDGSFMAGRVSKEDKEKFSKAILR